VGAPPTIARVLRLLGGLALIVVIFALVWPGRVAAQGRDLKWKTLETEHFYVHYYAGEEHAAERTAMVAERAYSRLSVALGHEVFLKTHITLVDNTDSANGSATAAPFPRINAFATAPDSMSVLESYDDWLDILITHEFVHVVHLDTAHGIPRLVNALLGFGVLGKIWMPNVIQPRWFVEGWATYEESRLTSQGRLRSAQFDNMLRMHVLEQGFLPIDRVSNGANLFPHGTVVYLYGLHLVRYIATRYGHDKLRELSHVYGGMAIPYGINRSLKKVLGVDYEQLWAEFELDTTRRFAAQARRIRARGIREGRRMTFSVANQGSSQFYRHPFWSVDDQWLHFYADDGHTNAGIRRLPARGGRIREGTGIGRQGQNLDIQHLFDVQDSSSGSFVGATGEIVYETALVHDFRYYWTDLFRWRGGDPKDAERLTHGMRARDPHVSPDGRTVVFARNDVVQSRLAFLDLETLDVTEVAPMERIQQVFSPRWAPDGRRVAFSAWREGGYRDVYVYDRESEALKRITADRFLDTEPAWTPDGRYILFGSDRDGVFNIYAHDTADGHLWQVTNVLGGAYEPVPSHDGTKFAYVGATSTGYDIWVMPFDRERFLEPLPVVDALPTIDDPTPSPASAGERPLSLGNRRYRPILTMFPRLITPATIEYSTSAAGTLAGFATGVTDVLGFHSLFGNFGYLVQQREPIGSVSYYYNRLVPNFWASFGRGFFLRNGFNRYDYDHEDAEGTYLQSGYRERVTRFNGGLSVPVIRHPIHGADASLGYTFTRYANADADPIDPNAPSSTRPEVGDVGQVDLGFTYSNVRSVRHAYADETGRRVSLRLSVLDRHLGGDFGDVQVTAAYTQFLRMPWRGHQVLAFRLGGGASAGGMRRRGAFFVGGFSQQEDIIRTLIARSALNEAGALQGYASGAFSGRYFSVFNVEYRIPLADAERGLGTLPLFFRRVTAVPFMDAGGAWTGPLTREVLKIGAGASMIFTFKVGYGAAVNLFLTYAHGFDREDGLDTFRLAVAQSF